MLRVQPAPLVLAAGLFCFTAGCDTPDAASKFCRSAVTTLSSTATVLADLERSCLREVNTTHDIGTFTLPTTSDPNCTAVKTQATAAESATILLSEYFSTINSLATVGTAKTSADAGTLVSNTAGAFQAGSAEKTALDSIAQDLTSGIMSAYQARKLARDLPKASTDVATIINGLVKIIQTNYLDQALKDEEKKLANPYKDFLLNHNSPEAMLILDQRWQADEQILQARRASAQSAIMALQALSKGFADLASSAHSLKAKELPSLLDPYVTQLQTLIPQIQKAF
jgi:hypothetical protein